MNYIEPVKVKTGVKVQCECYSRVAGYFRPVQQWNKGKQSEYRERQTVKLPALSYRASTRIFEGVM